MVAVSAVVSARVVHWVTKNIVLELIKHMWLATPDDGIAISVVIWTVSFLPPLLMVELVSASKLRWVDIPIMVAVDVASVFPVGCVLFIVICLQVVYLLSRLSNAVSLVNSPIRFTSVIGISLWSRWKHFLHSRPRSHLCFYWVAYYEGATSKIFSP